MKFYTHLLCIVSTVVITACQSHETVAPTVTVPKVQTNTASAATVVAHNTDCIAFAAQNPEANTTMAITPFGIQMTIPSNNSWFFPVFEQNGAQILFGGKRPSTPEENCTMYRDYIAFMGPSRSIADIQTYFATALQIKKTAIVTKKTDHYTYAFIQQGSTACPAPIAEVLIEKNNVFLSMSCSATKHFTDPAAELEKIIQSFKPVPVE